MTQRVFAWLDERLDLSGLRAFVAEKTVPMHRHSVWYYMGGITLFLVGVQVATGSLLITNDKALRRTPELRTEDWTAA